MEDWLPPGNPWFTTALGMVAGVVSTSSFVPQLLKAWREEDVAAISKRTYIATVAAFSLWIAYGVALGSVPIVLFNTLSLALSGAILVLKIRGARRRSRGTGAAAAR